MTQAFPLAWPQGWPRTVAADRRAPKFHTRTREAGRNWPTSRAVTVAEARGRLQAELDLLRATLPVLSSNMELRLDGQPRSGQRDPDDPGVAVYFQLRGKPRVLACDRWLTVAGNIAAIAAHIDAMRGMDRWGVGSVDRLFEGFTALPAAAPGQRHWRQVLGISSTLSIDAAGLESLRRALARQHHPDVPGGSAERMAEINAAVDQALREIGL